MARSGTPQLGRPAPPELAALIEAGVWAVEADVGDPNKCLRAGGQLEAGRRYYFPQGGINLLPPPPQ